jgi:hypothetical protein
VVRTKWLVGTVTAMSLIGALANGCSSSTPFAPDNPCPGQLTCPNYECCPIGTPFECNGKCYSESSPCGTSYVTCSGPSGGSSGGSPGANGNGGSSAGGGCPSGTSACGASYCTPNGDVCCANAGHPELSCPSGATCNANGTCSGGSGGGGGGGGSTGVPCSESAHPAWQQGECQTAQTCNCTMKACVRVANGGCCSGYDLGWIFIPCSGSGGQSCGDCTQAAISAAQQCGCTH